MVWKLAAGAFNQGLLLGCDRRAWSEKHACRGGIPHVEIEWGWFQAKGLEAIMLMGFVFTKRVIFSGIMKLLMM